MPARARAFVSVALWIAIVYFFVLVLRQVDWHAVASHRLNVPLGLLVLVIGTASRFLLPVVWATVLSSLEGKPMRSRVLLWPYAESWMARYLPGKVAFIGTRVLAANRYGYSRVNAIISGGVEVVMQIVMVTMLSVLLLGLGVRSALPFNVMPVLALAVGLGLLISPPVLRRLVDLYLHVQKKTDASVSYLSWSAISRAALVLSMMYVVQSTYSVLLAQSLGMTVDGHRLVFLGTIFVSTIAGIVAFFAPGGIGVRELVFVQVLQVWFPKDQLVSFAIFWRLAETLMDLLFVVVARIVRSGGVAKSSCN
ncbi:MAG TPA: lysylphosphatidylglycerol synthase domain-containing protein [Vicinamibacterales bacterium]